MMKNIPKVAMGILIALILTGCSEVQKEVIIENISEEPESLVKDVQIIESEAQETESEITVSKTSTVNFMAVGDNLYHSTVYKKGITDEGYNFDFIYEPIREFIESYDVAVVNQETPLVTSNYSSYPTFGTPIEAGEALINNGFNVILNATNHTYDKGYDGVQSTLSFYNSYPEVTYLGIHKDQEDYETVKIIEVNDIKIAMLNYTYGLNGFVIPEKYSYLVDTLYDEEKIKQDLLYAEENADVTIVFPHWGTEYVYKETEYQTYWANLFTEYGADVIIGSHPHVCEPVKYIYGDNGNKSLCYYSLGNFVSGQDEKPRILGGIASFKIVKIDEEVEIIDCKFLPCVTYRTPSDIGIYMLEDYTDEMARETNLKASEEYLWSLWYEINGDTDIEYTTCYPAITER